MKSFRDMMSEASGNLPGQRTHIINKDIRHPEHGIITTGTVVRHVGGNQYELRAGRARGKIIGIDKQHVDKMSMEEVDLEEGFKPGDFVKDPSGNIHRVMDMQGNTLHTSPYRGKDSYGGKTTLHVTKATKINKPADVTEGVENVEEGYDKSGFHTSVSNGKFMPSKYGNEGHLYLHDTDNESPRGGAQLATFSKHAHAKKAATQHGGSVVKTDMDTYRVVKPAKQGVEEGFADDFLAMAKEKNPNARISTADQRKKEAEELAKKREGAKPVHAAPTGNARPLGGYDPKSGRSYSEEVELEEGATVLSGRPTTHAEHEYSTSAGTHPASHVEKTLGLKSGSISKDKKTYMKHGDVHVRTTPVGKHVQVSLVRKHGKFGQDTSKHDEQRESLRSKLLKKNEEVELDELRNVTQDQLGSRMGSSGPGFNKTPAGKAREVKRKQEHLKGQMQFTKSQGGISGPKGKLPEETEIDEAKNTASKPYYRIVSNVSPELKKQLAAADEKRRENARQLMNRNSTAENGQQRAQATVKEQVSEQTQTQGETMSTMEQYLAAIEGKADFRSGLDEKTLTTAELKKREEVAKAIERENPGMDKSKKMAIATATAKKVAEEAEQIDELDKKTLGSYVKKATRDVADKAWKAGTATSLGDPLETGKIRAKAFFKAKSRMAGIDKATDRMTKEEAELDEELKGEMHPDAPKILKHIKPEHHSTYKPFLKKGVYKGGYADRSAVLSAAEKAGHINEGKKTHTVPETESEKDLASAAHPKDKITHKDVLVKRGVVKAEEVDLDEELNLLESLLEEEDLDEGILDTIKKKASDLEDKIKGNFRPQRNDTNMDRVKRVLGKVEDKVKGNFRHTRNDTNMDRIKNAASAVKTHAIRAASKVGLASRFHPARRKEEQVREAMISYSEFQDKIAAHRRAGNKVVDDKYDEKKASYTTIDKEGVGKKITHTPAGHKQEHLGNLKGDDDQAEVKPTEKRGRGRPTGTKSGARH